MKPIYNIDYLRIFRRWWLLVVAFAVFSSISAYVFSHTQKPVYRATSQLLVIGGNNSGLQELNDLQATDLLAQSYVVRLKNLEILEMAASNLGLVINDVLKLQETVFATNLADTRIIRLSVENSNPEIARNLANEIPQVFAERNSQQQEVRYSSSKENLEQELLTIEEELLAAEQTLQVSQDNGSSQAAIEQARSNAISLRETHSRILQSYEDVRFAEASTLASLIIEEKARLPETPFSPRTLMNTLLATVAGIMVAVGIAFLIEYLDNSIHSPDEIEQLVGLPQLAGIARMENADSADAADVLVMYKSPRSVTAESYRLLRTNLQFATVDQDAKSILVTSANSGDGKSTTISNLALALTHLGKQVILVDADMRRPTIHKKFNIGNNLGLSDLMVNKNTLEECLSDTVHEGLRILTTGSLPPNPAELIGSKRMEELIAELESVADYVLFDSPPVLAVADSSLLSRLVGSTIFVVSAAKTKRDALVASVLQLRNVGAHVAGVVINQITKQSRYGAYDSYYYASEYQAEEEGTPNSRKRLRLKQFGLTSLSQLLGGK